MLPIAAQAGTGATPGGGRYEELGESGTETHVGRRADAPQLWAGRVRTTDVSGGRLIDLDFEKRGRRVESRPDARRQTPDAGRQASGVQAVGRRLGGGAAQSGLQHQHCALDTRRRSTQRSLVRSRTSGMWSSLCVIDRNVNETL
ncbi:hypothetical protein GCM10014715_72210 [Streptomyces spiralis]|uniref:Uncharacterized protein n=1 Tax=Streptomyces spiralis TaxID=66376 RepID=A0A919AG19_9ACTN|nr:hypothetical protein GCM10014715_72210 [Streptomyces spiralis]